jgi:hypothetical protein
VQRATTVAITSLHEEMLLTQLLKDKSLRIFACKRMSRWWDQNVEKYLRFFLHLIPKLKSQILNPKFRKCIVTKCLELNDKRPMAGPLLLYFQNTMTNCTKLFWGLTYLFWIMTLDGVAMVAPSIVAIRSVRKVNWKFMNLLLKY